MKPIIPRNATTVNELKVIVSKSDNSRRRVLPNSIFVLQQN